MATKDTRNLRVSLAVNGFELRQMNRAAKVVKMAPAVFAREAIKRLSRSILKSAGVQVRLGIDDLDAVEGSEKPDRDTAKG